MGKISREMETNKESKGNDRSKKFCNKKLVSLLIDWARLEKRICELEEMSV